MSKLKNFYIEFNKTKTVLRIAQIIILISIIGIMIQFFSFIVKTDQLTGIELTNYFNELARDHNLFHMRALTFELNWTPDYFKDIYIYNLLGDIPILILLLYIFQQLKNIFIPFEDQNQPFTNYSAKVFKRIGISIIVWYIVQMNYNIIFPLNIMIKHNEIVSSNDLIGEASLFLDLRMLLITSIIASIFIGLSQIFKRGLEIKLDNDSII